MLETKIVFICVKQDKNYIGITLRFLLSLGDFFLRFSLIFLAVSSAPNKPQTVQMKLKGAECFLGRSTERQVRPAGEGGGGRKALARNWLSAIKSCCETADKGSPLTAGLFSGVLVRLLRVGKDPHAREIEAAGVWRTDVIAEPSNDNSVAFNKEHHGTGRSIFRTRCNKYDATHFVSR